MQQEQHTKHDDDDKSSKEQRDKIAPPTLAAICVWTYVVLAVIFWAFLRKQIPIESEYIKVGVESMFNLALLILVTVQTGLYFRQAKALDAQVAAAQRQTELVDESTKAAERSAIYAQRAYVTAKIRGIGERDETLQFWLRIENSGQTPANNVVVVYGCGLRERPPCEKDASGQLVCDNPEPYVKRFGVVAPNKSYHVLKTPETAFQLPDEYNRFVNGELSYYCWGRIVYEDIFNQMRTTWFCFFQSIAEVKGFPCEYGNEAI